MSRLIIDVDNVLWDAYPWTIEAANRIFNKNITIHDVKHWYGWEGLLGPNWFDAFTESLDPQRVKDREPLQGSKMVLNYLSRHYYLHFVSHNPRPKALHDPLDEWIASTYSLKEYGLSIFGARNCKIDYMDGLGDCIAIIEDKPSTLRKAVKRGYIAFGRTTPLNRNEDIPKVNWFDNWGELFGVYHVLEAVA